MTKLFNQTSEKLKRQELRRNMTKAEAIVWQKLRCKIENCKFRNQYSVERFVLDFYSPETKLVIEIDGESHFKRELHTMTMKGKYSLNQPELNSSDLQIIRCMKT